MKNSREFWVLRDRRDKWAEIIKDVVDGNLNSIYLYESAAKRAVLQTEKVWKVTVSIKPS